jgi:hypothetical protein
MKLSASKLWSARRISIFFSGGLGLLAYIYFLAFPWYCRAIEDYRWSVIMRERYEAGLTPMMASMESMVPVVAPAGEHHKSLRMVLDLPGVTQPKFAEASSAKVQDDASVVGIIIHGKAYAFARDSFVNPEEHIVNLSIDEMPISVTYCSFRDCFRVLTRESGAEPIDLHVGGLDVSNQLVFLLEDVRYGQTSPDIPLEDFPFESTTFGEWKRQHPETLVYGG